MNSAMCRRRHADNDDQKPEPTEPGLGNLDKDFDAEIDPKTLLRLAGLRLAPAYEAAA